MLCWLSCTLSTTVSVGWWAGGGGGDTGCLLLLLMPPPACWINHQLYPPTPGTTIVIKTGGAGVLLSNGSMNLPASTVDDVVGEMGGEGAGVRACLLPRPPRLTPCLRPPPARAVTKLRGTGVTILAMNKTEPVAVTTNVQLCEWQGEGGTGSSLEGCAWVCSACATPTAHPHHPHPVACADEQWSMPVNAPAGFVGSVKLSNSKMNINFGLRSGAGATGFSFFKLGAWAGGRARARSSTARPACRTPPAKHAHTDTHAPRTPPPLLSDISLFPQYPLTPPVTGLLADGSLSAQLYSAASRAGVVLKASIDTPLPPGSA